MADTGQRLTVRRVQAMAYQVQPTRRKAGVTNYLVELRATDGDGQQVIGLGECQPRDAGTGDRGGTSWDYLVACIRRLHDRDFLVTGPADAVATVRSVMAEFDELSSDFSDEADRLVPFRGTRVGIETALLDLMARTLDLPLATLLGGRRTKVTAQGAAVSAQATARTLATTLREQAIQFPVTLLYGADQVAHAVKLLENAAEINRSDDVGAPDKPLWIDLNGRLGRKDAIALVDEVVAAVKAGRLPRDVTLEQPVATADGDLMPVLQRRADRAGGSDAASPAVRIMADQSAWDDSSLGRRARLRLRLGSLAPGRTHKPRSLFLCPAQVGGLLASIELAGAVAEKHPETRIYLGGMPGATAISARTIQSLAMALPEIDSVADESLAAEPVITASADPGLGIRLPYEAVLGGAKDFFSLPEVAPPTLDGRRANVYPEVTYLQPLGSNGTKGHLLEREALAVGLSTTRYSKGAFIATDGVHEPLSFKWSRSPLSSAVSLALCTHKEATRLRLRRAGVPVPRGSTFAAGAYDAARAFVKRIGYPVVVKPAMGVRGIGVVANIQDDEALEAAFTQLESSRLGADDFIVEQHVNGRDYRIVVIGDEVIGAILREPGSVTGDGERSVAELVIAKNIARRDNPHLWGRPVKYDDAAKFKMERAGLTLEYVPKPGEKVVLSGSCSLSQGGESIDVLDELHPTIKDAAVRAVQAVPGLAFCGVDFLIEDHTKPLEGQQAGICELNAHAAIGNCEYPLYGTPRQVARTLLEQCVEQFDLVTTERADRLALHLRIRGRVTGVGYRDWVKRRADLYGLAGWVWNVDDRTVEAVVVGDMEPATALVAAAVLGPRAAVPTDVTTTHIDDLPALNGFSVVDRPPREFDRVR